MTAPTSMTPPNSLRQRPEAAGKPLAALSRPLRQALRQTRGWGWPGLLGLACVAPAALLAALWLPTLQQASQRLRTEADAAQLRALRLSTRATASSRAMPPAQRYRDGFPDVRARQARVAAVIALATAHGLDPQRGEFRLSAERDIGLMRYGVTMPLIGPYEKLRAFIEEAQARDPALALDHLRLKRTSATATSIEADLNWSFYMQDDATPEASREQVRGAPQ